MKTISVVLLIILILPSLQSCSSIVNGTTQKISVNSNVQGAEVKIDGQVIGRTPVVNARIKRQDSSFLTVQKEGYKDYEMKLQTKFDPWFWGNIVIGGVFGSTTDLVSGTTHLLDPDTIFVQMEPESGSALKTNTEADQKIRSYVINSYTHLVKDIKNGKGAYLKSLLKLMNVEATKNQETVKKLQSMTVLYDNVSDFTEEVVKLSNKK